jgi:asparagine synthetase B (glutamine-hydrolysing)
LGDGLRLSDYLAPDVIKRVDPTGNERTRYQQLLAEVPRLANEAPKEARMREALYLGMAGPLAIVLERMERMSTAAGVQVQFPYCDHALLEYVWNVPWSMKSFGGLNGLLKHAMGDALPESTLGRQKSAHPHIQNPQYDKAVMTEARVIVSDRTSAVSEIFDVTRLKDLMRRLSSGEGREQFLPGGASSVHMLIHIIELNAWIRNYRVSLR